MKKSNDLFSAMHNKMTPSQEVIERLFARAEAEIQSDNSDSKPSESMNGGIIMNKRDIDTLEEKTIEHPSRRGAFAASAAALILVFGIGAAVVMGGRLNKGAGSGEVPFSESVPESVTDDVKETTVSFKAPDTWAAVTEENSSEDVQYKNKDSSILTAETDKSETPTHDKEEIKKEITTLIDKKIVPKGTKAEIVITEDEAVTTALNDRGVTPDDLQKTDFGNIGEPRLTDVQFSTAEDGTPVYTVTFCLYEENAQKTKKLLNSYEYKINAADGLPMEKNVSPRKINSNDAMEIALADRGVTREEVVEANKEKETVSISAGIGKLGDGTPVINVTFGYPKQNEDGSSTYYNCDYTIAALGGEIIDKKIVTDDSVEKTGLITENEAVIIALNDCGITLEDLHETDFGMTGEPRKTDVRLDTLEDGTPVYTVVFNVLDNDPEKSYSVEYIHTYTINAGDGTIIDKKSEGYV